MSDATNPAQGLCLTLVATAIVVALATTGARAQRVVRADSAPPSFLAISQYHHDRWTTVDGLPNQAIDWMARSPDGYLWLGTEGGLVRFDGVRFTTFDRNNTPAFQGAASYPIVPLHVDRQGVLWISTSTGLVRYRDGELTRAAASAQPLAASLQRMVEDRSGRLWVSGQDSDGRLYGVRDGRLVAPDPRSGLPTSGTAIAADTSGDLLVAGVDRSLLRVHDAQVTRVLPRDALPEGVVTLYVSRDGTPWVGTQHGFGRVNGGRFEFHPLGAGLVGYVSAFAEDTAGDVWIGTVGMGVLRWHAGRLERFDRRNGLSRDQVTSLVIDGEGSIWVGTRGGLDRLRRGAVATFTPPNGGPPFADPGALLRDRSGRFILAGATTGLVAGHPGAWAPLPGAEAAATRKIWTIAEGKSGLWVGGDDTLSLYHAGGRSRFYTPRDGLTGKWVLAVAEDSLGQVWVGTDHGLFRLTRGAVRAFTRSDRLPNVYVRALVIDRRGALWAGTNAGVARIVGDSIRSWGTADGIAGPFVFAIHESRDGSIWLGTSGGITRVRDGAAVPIHAEQGLPGEMVTAIEEADGALWIDTGSGISRMPLSELNAVADGRAARVHATTFGTRDGLQATEVVAGAQPLSAQTADGRLWFSTAAGLAVIDPRNVPRNVIAPAVHIEEVSADGKRLTRSAEPTGVKVPARTRRLTLQYTATSLLIPSRVRFRYELVGYDRGWVDAPGGERVVSYTNLGPGRYTFRVIAANDAGVWNLHGAALAFTVAPAFYQTIWFGVLCAAALMAVFLALHQVRVRQLERQGKERKRADEALAELRAELTHAARLSSLATLTASIAHEVNQPLSGIVTNAGTCVRMLASDPPNVDGARAVAQRLIRDGNRAADVIAHLRALFSSKPSAAEPVDLNDATREVIALSRTELRRARATLHAELAEDLPIVMGDRVQLQQIISNLVRNACDAVHEVADRPREIVIRTSRDDANRVGLSVQDSGVGFGPNGAQKVFDAFYTTKDDGMGIGLSVCRTIIENHRGRLWAVSNDGPGVTFAFSLPCGPAQSLGPDGPSAIPELGAPETPTTRVS